MAGDTVIVGLSGGVDSAVSALRLIEAGHRVEGLFMFNWAEDEAGYCNAAEDFQSARAAADVLGIPLHRADFSAEYRERVFQDFLDEYAAGRTPNPDLLCNREVKFKAFRDYALRLGADAVATGHYAAVRDGLLYRAADENKDQSYFLAAVPTAGFERVIFPLHDLPKPEVRARAEAAGLPNHARKDSTGICFIGERDFKTFLQGYLGTQAGDIVSDTGRLLGRHQGLAFHTIGQRKGLGIGGVKGAPEAPWFVAAKDMGSNTLLVTQDKSHPGLAARSLRTRAPNWIGPPPDMPARLQGRIRHRQPLIDCTVTAHGDGLRVDFEASPWAIAPGQFVVLYDGRRCLGAAVIEAAVPHFEAPSP